MPGGPLCSVPNLLRAAGLAALLATLCAAQAQLAPPSPNAATAASALAPEAVSLDFAIRTRSGKPVLDLKPSDLLLTDNGLAADLKNLRLVKGTGSQDQTVTLVFDSLDVAPAQNARKLADKILSQFPKTGYTFAVMEIAGGSQSKPPTAPSTPGAQDTSFLFPSEFPPRRAALSGPPGLRLVENYTTSRDLLRRAIAQAANGDAVPPALAQDQPSLSAANDPDPPNPGALLRSAVEDSQHPGDDAGAGSSLSALLALARSQAPIPGRKLIVYFSQGLPAADSGNTVDSLIAEANRSQISIVTVDLEPGGRAASHAMLKAMGPDPAAPLSAPAAEPPLPALAAATNGAFFASGSNSKEPLRQLRDELTDYYEASYTPSLASDDGKFHPLVVHAQRPNLVVRTSTGYFALPPDGGSGARLYEVPLLAVLAAPQSPAEIAFRAQVLHVGEFSGRNTGELVVEVPISHLLVRTDADTNLLSVHLAILMRVRNAHGDVLQSFSEDILRHTPGSDARLASAWGQDAIVMQRPFPAAPGDYTLEAAVLDQFANKTAVQRVKFTIAPPRPPILLSDLTLVRRVTPLGQDADRLEPLRYKSGRIIPDLTDVLPPGTDRLTFFVLAHLAGEAQPRLTLRILRDGRQVSTIPATLAPAAAPTRGEPATEDNLLPWLGTLQTSALPPGHYEVQAILSENGQTATASRSFVVEGPAAAADASFTAVAANPDLATDSPAERRLAESAALGSTRFSISIPANPLPPPTPAELQALVDSARQRALAWTDSLPNFLCVETIWHSVYAHSSRSWQPMDTAVQLVRYMDHAEDRTLVELNGNRHRLPVQVDFAHSTGEFGGALRGIFDPAAQAQFTWQGADYLDGGLVQVLAYKVVLRNSLFAVTNGGDSANVAYHGLVWIDAATYNIRRITETIENPPAEVGVRASSISIDYAWMAIDHHEYMLPVHGALSVLRSGHRPELNQFTFTDYHRFGAHVRILPSQPMRAQTAAPPAPSE